MVMRSKKFDMAFKTVREYRQVYRRSYQARHEVQKLAYNKRSRRLAYNVQSRWNDIDKARALAHDIPDQALSKLIGRSVQAIQAVRYRELMKAGGIYV